MKKVSKGKKFGRCDHHTAEFIGDHIYLPRTRCDFKAVKRLRICQQDKKTGGPIFADLNLCDFHANTTWYHKNVGWTIVGEFTSIDEIVRPAGRREGR